MIQMTNVYVLHALATEYQVTLDSRDRLHRCFAAILVS